MENQKLKNKITAACQRIAPAWPLKNSVAVNPFLGISDLNFNRAAQILNERSGIQMCMPLNFYREQLAQKNIVLSDVKKALSDQSLREISVEDFIESIKNPIDFNHTEIIASKTIIDAAEELTKKSWNEFFIDKISAWASVYFDQYQVTWNTVNTDKSAFLSWKQEAEIDRSTELMGIKNFRKTVKNLPNDPFEAAQKVCELLNISEEYSEAYFHTLLLKVIGWSSYIAGQDWDNNLYEGETNNLQSFLCILLVWELCLLESNKSKGIGEVWQAYQSNRNANEHHVGWNDELTKRLVLQKAYDFALQRELIEKFRRQNSVENEIKRAKAQAVFCIDVRSEVFRRNLELNDPEIETIGFAGFFGLPINYVPLGHNTGKNQCPVLIPSQITVKETLKNRELVKTVQNIRKQKHQVQKNWNLFKTGAVSSFGFVSPLGLSFLPKLLSDSFGWTRPVKNPETEGVEKWLKNGRDIDLSGINLSDKINMAFGALKAMGLNDNMAPIVLIVGHGASSINNPHATSLDCGACGGHSGEVNAQTAAKILNDNAVRAGLMEKDVFIPLDTHFVACLHNTTTDEIKVLDEENVPKKHIGIFSSLKNVLRKTSKAAREERAKRMDLNAVKRDELIFNRSADWSQVRPEWGLAGCHSFIIAPRFRTREMDLGGKSFLHSYDWNSDQEFRILETIMTAPMVVTSWINLQYYASTTDNLKLGSGNKTLHNVTGGFGVLEGSAGDLRIGLPLQSIHDGKQYQHLPYRLNVIIEAPIKAITAILNKNEGIKELCDNEWINLFHLNEEGKISHRYVGEEKWQAQPSTFINAEKEEFISL